MQNQKGDITLIIVGIIALLVIGGGVGYFVAKKPAQKEEQKQEKQTNQQQIQQEQKPISEITEQKTEQPEAKDETADWKTYRNEKYGYEVKYPDNWDVSALDLNCPPIMNPILKEHNLIGFVRGKEMRDCIGPDKIGEFVIKIDTIYPERIHFGRELIRSEEYDININGAILAKKIKGLFQGHGEISKGFAFTTIIFKKSGFYFSIYDSSGSEEGSEETTYRDIFEKFISTFKFVK